MPESKKKKTGIEKLKEEKKDVEEELAEAMKKQEQIEHQLQRAENWADFVKDNERRRRTHRLVIKGAIVEDIAPCTELRRRKRGEADTVKNDKIVEVKPNYEYLDHYRDTCGYFWIVSTEDLSVEEALNCYRHRDGVEKVFRGIKTDSDLNKMYSQLDAAMEAKNFVAFLTAILRADILLRLKPYLFQYSQVRLRKRR